MVASATLRAAIFPTRSCICKMSMTKDSQLTVATISVGTGKYISENGYGKIQYTAPVKVQRPVLANIPCTVVKKIKKTMTSKSTRYGQVEELIMIDAIQRLGLEYYFHDEIQDVLERHHVQCITIGEYGSNLHDVALRFRLLRQAGYNVSADIFSRFKNKDGKFSKELGRDMRGLMSLFEASQLSTPVDHILDYAGEFCGKLLKSTLKNGSGQPEARLIGTTLRSPYHKSLPRLITQNEVNTYETSIKILHDCSGMSDWIYELQDLARIDVNKAYISHGDEITQVSRWWKELCLTEKLTLARNQPVKWHMWSLVILPGPNMAELRTELTKAISFIYIIDDIYDVYGTIKELTLFTEAVNRWDYANTKDLPDYMTMCLKALYDTTNDISSKIYNKHGWNPKVCLQKAWAELCNAFLVETRWLSSGHLPNTEEYLKNGIISSGVYVVSANIFSLLGEAVNHRSTILFNSHPDIVSSAARILRLWDDLGTSKDENQIGRDGSFIACYMNQHKDSSAESAQEYVLWMISDAWKSLNKECLSHSPFSAEFKAAFLNLARMVPIMYSYDDNHRFTSFEKHMKSVLHN
ncbi:(3S,6E)-nerolidol synthase 1 isoform X2 [Spinacia oleracea]|uniref:(3S,6E)-nerolidol synthase 1 isoform X2 n=1 Tax=Spinacia oleracea TaxID=3562 RepID=A0A9R0JWX6_SPIOL|nr:(3S,6E)-nerolidol synthase 1-like isoform X2 [Spinacia oleracea]